MCLAQGHNAVTLLRLEPTTPQSQVKHSITEPLRSHMIYVMLVLTWELSDKVTYTSHTEIM